MLQPLQNFFFFFAMASHNVSVSKHAPNGVFVTDRYNMRNIFSNYFMIEKIIKFQKYGKSQKVLVVSSIFTRLRSYLTLFEPNTS